jgi:deferrochelatase/peroxidase EfeB
VTLPAFTGENLDPSLCDGDLGVQVCADDPQVAFHAMHNLMLIASPVVMPRWSLTGFGRTSNSRAQQTPRNLMGFKDGTANIMSEDAAALERYVWASAPASPAWMHGGSYMVARRIKMRLGAWDATGLHDQERAFGRDKVTGAPLSGGGEHASVDLSALNGGVPAIPADAHVRLAHPSHNDGQRLLRRGYSFSDGIDHATGSPSGGLMFICYQRDPTRQFVPIQRRLSRMDALNRHIEHVGSAVFACPPGVRPDGFVGEQLFA